jgi:hypothetical protein
MKIKKKTFSNQLSSKFLPPSRSGNDVRTSNNRSFQTSPDPPTERASSVGDPIYYVDGLSVDLACPDTVTFVRKQLNGSFKANPAGTNWSYGNIIIHSDIIN